MLKDLISEVTFGFSEDMYGRYKDLETGAEGKYDFSVVCTADNFYKFLFDKTDKRRLGLEGIVRVSSSSQVHEAPIHGSLVLFEDMKLKYEFAYVDPVTDEEMLYRGQKNITPLHPVKSMTTLYGKVYCTSKGGIERADVLSYFLLSDLFDFLKTFRLKFA